MKTKLRIKNLGGRGLQRRRRKQKGRIIDVSMNMGCGNFVAIKTNSQ